METGRIPSLLLVLAVLVGCGAPDPRVVEIREVRRWYDQETRPVVETPSDAEAVTLIDRWSPEERVEHGQGWYRATVPLDVATLLGQPLGIHLPRVAQNVAVWVNGRFVGNGGSMDGILTRNWNRPLLFPLPEALLVDGPNTIDLRLVTEPDFVAYLYPFQVGPLDVLRADHSVRFFMQSQMPALGVALVFATAFLLGFIGLRQQDYPQFGYYGLGCLLWGIASTQLFWTDVPLSGRTILVLGHFCAAGSVTAFIFAIHRGGGFDGARAERVLGAGLAAAALLLIFSPSQWFDAVSFGMFGSDVVAGVYMMGLMSQARRSEISGSRATGLRVLAVFALVLMGHDALLIAEVRVPPPYFVLTVLNPFAAIYGGWLTTDYLLNALNEGKTLNRELEGRVAQKHAELEQNFERLRRLEQERAVGVERERLMREMHDGMGGQMVSALAMAEDPLASRGDIAETLRGALDDMRLVIDSLDPIIDDVPTLLGMLRARIEPRLSRQGIRFDWRVNDLPPVSGLGSDHFLHILRIVQEAITNILKHAGAEVITVETGTRVGEAGREGIFVRIADDGCAVSGARPGGRGMQNMHARAERVGGTLDLALSEDGTTVDLWIPLAARPGEVRA